MNTVKIPPLHDIYNQRLFGVGMGQTFTALLPFEWILNTYSLYQIVELGTGQGGLSLFLWFQCRMRNLDFATFDRIDRRGIPVGGENKEPIKNKPKHWEMQIPYKHFFVPVEFYEMDIFNSKGIAYIEDILLRGKTLLYCDNGAKPKEVRTFAPMCMPGSVIGVHDWHEPHFESCKEIIKENNMQVILQEFCEKHKTRQRFWYKGE